jgi:hypothetical protein
MLFIAICFRFPHPGTLRKAQARSTVRRLLQCSSTATEVAAACLRVGRTVTVKYPQATTLAALEVALAVLAGTACHLRMACTATAPLR